MQIQRLEVVLKGLRRSPILFEEETYYLSNSGSEAFQPSAHNVHLLDYLRWRTTPML